MFRVAYTTFGTEYLSDARFGTFDDAYEELLSWYLRHGYVTSARVVPA